jgi:hypothetical protein
MNGILIAVLIVTGLLIYKIISSSRKQEGYKRWKATGSGNTTNEETSKNKWEHGAWLRHALGVVTPKARTYPVFDEEAVVWCAGLLTGDEAAFRAVHEQAPAAALAAMPPDTPALLISANRTVRRGDCARVWP